MWKKAAGWVICRRIFPPKWRTSSPKAGRSPPHIYRSAVSETSFLSLCKLSFRGNSVAKLISTGCRTSCGCWWRRKRRISTFITWIRTKVAISPCINSIDSTSRGILSVKLRQNRRVLTVIIWLFCWYFLFCLDSLARLKRRFQKVGKSLMTFHWKKRRQLPHNSPYTPFLI